MSKLLRLTAGLLACCLLTGCAGNTDADGQNNDAISKALAEDDANYVDSLTPATDFYGYINARALLETELKEGASSVGTLCLIRDETEKKLDDIIHSIADSEETFEKGSNEQLIHDLYWLSYDTFSGKRDDDRDDTALIDGMLDKVGGVQSLDELYTVWHDITRDYGIMPFMGADVTGNIYQEEETVLQLGFQTLVDLNSIRTSDISAVNQRDGLTSQLRLCGVRGVEAEKRATEMIYTYCTIAGSTEPEPEDEQRKYHEFFHLLTQEECSGILQHISYEQLIRACGYDDQIPDQIVLLDPEQMKAIDGLLDEAHLQVWKDITMLQVLQSQAQFLPDKYAIMEQVDESPDKTALKIVKYALQFELGEIYGEQYFTEEKRRKVQALCDELVSEYRHIIDDADWISEEGKAFLTDKLNHMKFYIGNDTVRHTDPDLARIGSHSLMQTTIEVMRIKKKSNFATLGKTNENDGFRTMAASTVNACYSPYSNSITITAAILDPLLFDEHAEHAWNLGAIGYIIGHEISHGFDSQGVLYDAYGNYRPDAMPPEDVEAFRQIKDKTVAYFNRFTILGSHVKGKLTLSENLADISGLQCVLAIAGTPDQQKIVFESFGKTWRALETYTYAKNKLDTDVHSPNMVRINAVVSCFDEYYEIYGVKEGDPMYVAPEDRVRRW